MKNNPDYYKLDHKMTFDIWDLLHKEGYRYMANSVSKAMIEQGCQEIETNDTSKVLDFWRDYLEKNNIIKIGYK